MITITGNYHHVNKNVYDFEFVSETNYFYYVIRKTIKYLNCIIFKQAKAALMFDGVRVLMDAIVRLLSKKPDLIRKSAARRANANLTAAALSRMIECSPKGKIAPYEHGEKLSRMIRKVSC